MVFINQDTVNTNHWVITQAVSMEGSPLNDVGNNSADLQMRHQKLFTLARHLSVGHFE